MTFKNLRTTEYFSQLWCEIETFAKDHDIPIQTPPKMSLDYTYIYL